MVVVVDPRHAAEVTSAFTEAGERVCVLGAIEAGEDGVAFHGRLDLG
jgi:phosphoribosylaminoimidazole (AIR) synthetase